MSIIIRDLNGKSININIKRIDSIQSIKEKIQKRTGISINDQVLTFAGKYLENYKKLYEYKVLRNSILNLNLGLKGGAPPGSTSVFQSGSPNTDTKYATVGVAFSFTATNTSGSSVTTGNASASPTLPATLTTSVVSNRLVLSGTPILADVGSYAVTMTCLTGSGSGSGSINIYFTLNINPVTACIVSGQRILTPNGYKLIDNIYNGDLITTSANKEVKVINYRGDFEFTTKDTAPYIIPKDSIYCGCPQKDIFLSKDHKIKTDFRWITPKQLSKYNPNVRQINIGKPVIYFNIETPNYLTDHLVLEGTVIDSLNSKDRTSTENLLECL
jgi:hypothetical protein